MMLCQEVLREYECVYTTVQKFGVGLFLKDASHALHLFDQNSNIVKHYSNLKYLFSIYFISF